MNVIISVISGLVGALLLHLIKEHFLNPKIDIEFLNKNTFHPVTKYKRRDNTGKVHSVTQAKYLRFKVINRGCFGLKITAKNVRAYLSSLEVTDSTGKTLKLGEDWISLAFANSDGKTIIDLPAQVPQFVDIFHTVEHDPGELRSVIPILLKDYDLLKTPGDFNAELSIVADNVSIVKKSIKFKWSSATDFKSLEASS